MPPRNLLRVKVEDLHPDASQPRKHFGDEALGGLARSLRAHGQLQPVLVVERAGKLVLLDGERRWRAAKLAGLVTLEALVVSAEGPEALERALVANVQREDLDPIEKARAIARLMEATERPAGQIAESLGLSASTVSRLLALLVLPQEVQARIARGELAASTGYEIVRAGSEDEQKRLAAEVSTRGLTRATVAKKRRAAGRKSTGAGKQARGKLVAVLSGGRTITAAGKGLTSLDALVAWLEELAQKARAAGPDGLDVGTFLARLRAEAKTKPVPSTDSTDAGAA